MIQAFLPAFSRRAPLARSLRFLATMGDDGRLYETTVTQDKLVIKYVRASGPGGQNVNKVSTKADVRFEVFGANWLPLEARERLAKQQATRINKFGELVVQSDAQRTQRQNLRDAIEKVQVMVDEACIEPKLREQWVEGQGEESKKRR